MKKSVFGMLSAATVFAMNLHANYVYVDNYYIRDYLDAGQNKGEFRAGGDGYYEMTLKNGQTVSFPNIPMPDFGVKNDNAVSSLVGRNVLISCNHDGKFNYDLSFGASKYNDVQRETAKGLNGSGSRDFIFQRSSKFIVEGGGGYSPIYFDTDKNGVVTDAEIKTMLTSDRFTTTVNGKKATYLYSAGTGLFEARQNDKSIMGALNSHDTNFRTARIAPYYDVVGGQIHTLITEEGASNLGGFRNIVSGGDSGSSTLIYDFYDKEWKTLAELIGIGGHYVLTSFSGVLTGEQYDAYVAGHTNKIALNNGTKELKLNEFGTKNNQYKDQSFTGGGNITINTAINSGAGGLVFDNSTYTVSGSGSWSGGGIDIAKGGEVALEVAGKSGDALHKIGDGTLKVNVAQGGNLKVGRGTVELNAANSFEKIYLVGGNGEVKFGAENAANLEKVSFGRGGGTLDLNGFDASASYLNAADFRALITNTNEKASNVNLTNANNFLYHGKFTGNINIASNDGGILAFDGGFDVKNASFSNKNLILQGHAVEHAVFPSQFVNEIRQADSQTPSYQYSGNPSEFEQPDWDTANFNAKEMSLKNSTLTVGRNANLQTNLTATDSTIFVGGDKNIFLDRYDSLEKLIYSDSGFRINQKLEAGTSRADETINVGGKFDLTNSVLLNYGNFNGDVVLANSSFFSGAKTTTINTTLNLTNSNFAAQKVLVDGTNATFTLDGTSGFSASELEATNGGKLSWQGERVLTNSLSATNGGEIFAENFAGVASGLNTDTSGTLSFGALTLYGGGTAKANINVAKDLNIKNFALNTPLVVSGNLTLAKESKVSATLSTADILSKNLAFGKSYTLLQATSLKDDRTDTQVKFDLAGAGYATANSASAGNAITFSFSRGDFAGVYIASAFDAGMQTGIAKKSLSLATSTAVANYAKAEAKLKLSPTFTVSTEDENYAGGARYKGSNENSVFVGANGKDAVFKFDVDYTSPYSNYKLASNIIGSIGGSGVVMGGGFYTLYGGDLTGSYNGNNGGVVMSGTNYNYITGSVFGTLSDTNGKAANGGFVYAKGGTFVRSYDNATLQHTIDLDVAGVKSAGDASNADVVLNNNLVVKRDVYGALANGKATNASVQINQANVAGHAIAAKGTQVENASVSLAKGFVNGKVLAADATGDISGASVSLDGVNVGDVIVAMTKFGNVNNASLNAKNQNLNATVVKGAKSVSGLNVTLEKSLVASLSLADSVASVKNFAFSDKGSLFANDFTALSLTSINGAKVNLSGTHFNADAALFASAAVANLAFGLNEVSSAGAFNVGKSLVSANNVSGSVSGTKASAFSLLESDQTDGVKFSVSDSSFNALTLIKGTNAQNVEISLHDINVGTKLAGVLASGKLSNATINVTKSDISEAVLFGEGENLSANVANSNFGTLDLGGAKGVLSGVKAGILKGSGEVSLASGTNLEVAVLSGDVNVHDGVVVGALAGGKTLNIATKNLRANSVGGFETVNLWGNGNAISGDFYANGALNLINVGEVSSSDNKFLALKVGGKLTLGEKSVVSASLSSSAVVAQNLAFGKAYKLVSAGVLADARSDKEVKFSVDGKAVSGMKVSSSSGDNALLMTFEKDESNVPSSVTPSDSGNVATPTEPSEPADSAEANLPAQPTAPVLPQMPTNPVASEPAAPTATNTATTAQKQTQAELNAMLAQNGKANLSPVLNNIISHNENTAGDNKVQEVALYLAERSGNTELLNEVVTKADSALSAFASEISLMAQKQAKSASQFAQYKNLQFAQNPRKILLAAATNENTAQIVGKALEKALERDEVFGEIRGSYYKADAGSKLNVYGVGLGFSKTTARGRLGVNFGFSAGDFDSGNAVTEDSLAGSVGLFGGWEFDNFEYLGDLNVALVRATKEIKVEGYSDAEKIKQKSIAGLFANKFAYKLGETFKPFVAVDFGANMLDGTLGEFLETKKHNNFYVKAGLGVMADFASEKVAQSVSLAVKRALYNSKDEVGVRFNGAKDYINYKLEKGGFEFELGYGAKFALTRHWSLETKVDLEADTKKSFGVSGNLKIGYEF